MREDGVSANDDGNWVPAGFLKKVPKTDLHIHLDGSMRLSSLITLARDIKLELPSNTEDGLRETVFLSRYPNLDSYLTGFRYTVPCLRTAEALEQVAFEIVDDALNDGVRYMEIRFAPQLHVTEALTFEDVMSAVHKGFDRAKAEHNRKASVINGDDIPFEYGIIVCAMRAFGVSASPYFDAMLRAHPYSPKEEVFSLASIELARASLNCIRDHGIPIVGFDLAGPEHGYPAEAHTRAFEIAHRGFIKKTVHAGEAYGPESIFQAITDLHADRIGHGTYLFETTMIRNPDITDKRRYVEELAQYIADRRITIEVCLTSNLQTSPALTNLSRHPFWKMLDHRLSTTICTDNTLISNTSVTHELELAARHFSLKREELKNIVVYGFKRSFFPGLYREKREYVRRAIEQYERVERELLGNVGKMAMPPTFDTTIGD
jgi:adenosine deaminase